MADLQKRINTDELMGRVKGLSAKELDRLLNFAIVKKEYDLMWAIAKAENTSAKALEKMAEYPIINIQSAVGQHPNVTEKALRLIANAPFWGSRLAAASNVKTPHDCIDQLLRDPIKQVRMAAKDTLYKQEAL